MNSGFSLINNFISVVVQPIVALLFVVALLVFVYGVAEMIKDADNEEARKTGRRHILYGVIGLFIMVTANVILNIVKATFGI